MDPAEQRIDASRRRSLARVRRAIATVRRVIRQNRQLAEEHPTHRASAERRIREGHEELAAMGAEERKLERPAE
jgi:hypothetical protein